MTISLSSASLPVFAKFLCNLRHLLTKAQADVQARGYDEQALVQFRLAPDMLPFKRQISIACDAGKLWAARVSGLEAPVYENTEETLEALVGRIDKTLAWLKTVPPAAKGTAVASSLTKKLFRLAIQTADAGTPARV